MMENKMAMEVAMMAMAMSNAQGESGRSWDSWEGLYLESMSLVEDGGSPLYKAKRKIGKGSLEKVCKGRLFSCEKGSEPVEYFLLLVALKFEHKNKLVGHIKDDYPTDSLGGGGGTYGVPPVHYKGIQGNYFIMVRLEVLNGFIYFTSTPQYGTYQMLVFHCLFLFPFSLFLRVESCRCVNEKKLFLVDFGIATEWRKSCEGKHIEYTQHPWHTRGTLDFASVHA
ncbi:unnamed protein product [Coffea canephora]|uniref:Protein kinase domain-containing protein n=1 Tax=Coffea canephora TaxID=49390 RepID=A0A068V758_COFCA|nr:unnamed protein product [Coffea canephora]